MSTPNKVTGPVVASLPKAPSKRYLPGGRLLQMNNSTCSSSNYSIRRGGEVLQRCTFATTSPSSSRKNTSPGPSSSSLSSSAAPPSPPTSTPPTPSSEHLSWKQYLKLRKQRRYMGTFASFPTTAVAFGASSNYFLNQEIDPMNTIAGIDPVYVNIGLTMGCTALGFLAGPSVGNFLWSLFHSKQKQAIETKDRDFFKHIRTNRVDPSRQTMQNRLPDYYGEKIGSIEEYRQWLRDQAAFRRKAAHGVDNDVKAI